MNMFIGEMCCIFAYFYIRRKERNEYGDQPTPDEKEAAAKGLITNYNQIWLCIPAIFDVIASTLMYMGLAMVDASIMQIIYCTTLVWTAVFSYTYLGRRYKAFQYIGLSILLAGVLVVGFNSMSKDSGSSSQTSVFGVICLVLSMIFAGMVMVSEEKIVTKYYAHPLQLVGVEGATGLLIYTLALFALYYIPCEPNIKNDFCPYGRLEDVPRALMEICSSGMLIFAVICTIASLGSFNGFGVALTKNASATHRMAVNAVRPFVVWGFCLVIGWEKFDWIQLLGYIIAVYGMLTYYGLIPLNPFKLCAKKEEEEQTEETKKALTSE